MTYPPTPQIPVSDTHFGETLADPYRWLEDAADPRTKRWMAEEDAQARDYLRKLPARAALEKRLQELLYIPAITMPTQAGGRYFYERKEARQEKYVQVVKEGEQERVLLDPAALGESVSLGAWDPSYDGKRVAYTLRSNNSDEATLHILDVDTALTRKGEAIPGAKYASPSWLPDNSGFYYTRLPVDPKIPADKRPGLAEVRFHRLGDDPKSDVLVHAATGDARTFLGAGVSEDGHWLVAQVSHGWASTDLYYRAASETRPEAWLPLAVGLKGGAGVTEWNGFFYVQTTDPAFSPNGRGAVCRIPAVSGPAPARETWQVIVPESDAALSSVQVVGGKLALTYTRDASSVVELRDLDGTNPVPVPLPGIGSCGGLSGRAADDEAFYAFTSFTVPLEIHRLSVATGKAELWNRVEAPVDPAPYRATQVFYPSKDGTKVPMFIVQRKDAPRNGKQPFLVTGYGGFSVNMEPSFSASLYAWLEAGGAFAVPNLRGGGEYGEAWHQAGMLHAKQNVFDDFEAAADYLVKEKYTSPAKIAISGGSNGGLLVGAALVQRPALYKAVVCAVPLLDMIRYPLFGSGRTWIEEYGDPAVEADYKALRAYSPYQHVAPGIAYPAVLMLSADSDDRVDPMHARKMVAALQAASAGGPVLLRIEKHAGHGGADLVKSAVEQKADMYAFLFDQLGVAGKK